jgi:phospholipase D
MKYFLNILVSLFLISLATSSYAQTRVYFSPNGGCQDAIIKEINNAQKSIDIAMFAFTSRDIAYALNAAKERKVDIRIILDTYEIKDHSSKSRYLIHKNFDVKFHMGPGLFHDKFAVIDDKEVLTGSYNWTVSANKKNNENLLVIDDDELAKKYTKEFKHLWSQSGEAALRDTGASTDKD